MQGDIYFKKDYPNISTSEKAQLSPDSEEHVQLTNVNGDNNHPMGNAQEMKESFELKERPKKNRRLYSDDDFNDSDNDSLINGHAMKKEKTAPVIMISDI